MDDDDVRVVERRCRARLTGEPLPVIRAGQRLGAEHLDRDGAAQALVTRTINGAHAAFADLL